MFGMQDDDDPAASKNRVRHRFGDLHSKIDQNKQKSYQFGKPPPRTGGIYDLTGRKEQRALTDAQKERAEENRLLGSHTSRRDPNAVAIFPRGSKQMTKIGSATKALETFKPGNTLNTSPDSLRNTSSNKGRWKNSPGFGSSITGSRPASFYDDNSVERPRKKQKVNMPATDVIEIEDDDNSQERITSPHTKATVPGRHMLQRPSPVGRHTSKNQGSSSSITNEYWAVEKTVKPPPHPKKQSGCAGDQGDERDEDDTFTRSAKEARIKSQHLEREAVDHHMGEQRKAKTMAAVVVPVTVKKADVSKDGVDSSSLRNQFVQTDGQRRNNEQRESPDELQGDRTVGDSWRLRQNAERRVSPSNIRPTQFSPPPGKNGKTRAQRGDSRKKQPSISFAIHLFRSDVEISEQPLNLFVDEENRKLIVEPPNDAARRELDVSRANKITYSEDVGNTKIRFHFPRSQDSNVVDIQFATDKDTYYFYSLISGLTSAKTSLRDKEWMDKAFERSAVSPDKEPTAGLKRQSLKETPVDKPAAPQSPKHKRQKLAESLQNGNNVRSDRQPEHGKSDNGPGQRNIVKRDGASDIPSHAHPPPIMPEKGTGIPVKTYKSSNLTTRETRSRAKPRNFVVESDDEPSTSISPAKIRAGKWTKPLVYPRTGRKKAEVEAQDLERLHDSEFLNDNLIGFYTRFLEYHLERTTPDLAKRMYFFNSYFFASLTNTPRGVKGINYQAVEKWTRAVDIFSYDYIVVPINESAHWYIAIICNLPSLMRSILDSQSTEEAAQDADLPNEPQKDKQSLHPQPTDGNEDREAAGDTAVEAPVEHDQAPASSPSRSRSRNGTPIPNEPEPSEKDWPEEDENQPTSSLPDMKQASDKADNGMPTEDRQKDSKLATKSETAKPSKKRGGQKKPRPPAQKFDPKQPIIITFDSLGCKRSPTISILREYLEEEAEAKRSLTFDGKMIKGMTAQQIPLQPNFSDCGLYLLAYLERFIRDPDTFITKLLRREMDKNADWPRMRSGELRRRLRQFLLDLYEEQTAETNQKHGSGQSLVDAKPLHILLIEDGPTADGAGQMPKQPEVGTRQFSPKSTPLPTAFRPSTLKKTDRDRDGSEKKTRAEQPTTPIRSSPRFNRSERPEIQQTASPIASVDNHGPAFTAELLDGIEEFLDQHPVSSRHTSEAYVSETPPPKDKSEDVEVTMSSPTTKPNQHSKIGDGRPDSVP